MFAVHTKTQSQHFLRLKENFLKASFPVDNFFGLVWTVGPTVEMGLRLQIFWEWCRQGLRYLNCYFLTFSNDFKM